MNLSIGGNWVEILRWCLPIVYTTVAVVAVVGRRRWGHPIVNPALVYAAAVFGTAAAFRWAILVQQLRGFPPGLISDLTLNGSIQLTISCFLPTSAVMLILSGRRFAQIAEHRRAAMLQEAKRRFAAFHD